METTNQNKPTLQALWQLLQPSITYDTRGRYERCSRDWNAMDESQQLRVYRIIEAHINSGDGVNPNPFYALNDAMQEDEQKQAKAKSSERTPPKNYNGSRDFDQMVATGRLCTAEYNGQVGIYTIEDVTAHHMNLIKRLQP